jgi:peptide/nickel transport system substrate-binding protein
MGRSWDEPFALYGLLAESMEVDPNHMWVEFTLRPEARFSDGSPVTVEDVIWSYETLGTEGHPRYLNAWTRVASIEATGERSRPADLHRGRPGACADHGAAADPQGRAMGWRRLRRKRARPRAHRHRALRDRRFRGGALRLAPRDPDYWGADLPFRRGTNVIDEVRMEFFSDGTAMFEAFTSGILTTMRETNAAELGRELRFPPRAVGRGGPVGNPHRRPTGITGLVMNTRHDQFADWRVREAMIQAFNFEFINQTLNGGTEPRITSYFSNSPLGMLPGPAEGRVAEFLEPFADDLLPGAIEGYVLPVSDGSERNRAGIAEALRPDGRGRIHRRTRRDDGPDGAPFTFEILLRTDRPRTTPS